MTTTPKLPEPATGAMKVAEPIAWESTTICYTKFVSDRRYQKFSPKVQGWYKPYRCSSCESAQALASEVERLQAVKQAISDYHYALDMRQHGGVAQDRAFSAICNALDMHWAQGEEKARRALATQEAKA